MRNRRLGEAETAPINKMLDNNFGKPSGKKLEEEAPFPLTEVDKWVLSQTDEEFHLHSWDELREIIGSGISISNALLTFVGDAFLGTDKMSF